jgi:hypothetical protein
MKKILVNSSFLLPKFEQPIFIVSAPRSGSSYFYEILTRMDSVSGFKRENFSAWRYFFPYQKLEKVSDYIGANEVNNELARGLKSFIFFKLLKEKTWSKQLSLEKTELASSSSNLDFITKHLILRQPLRYIEKTISNCFHLDAIEQVFPDALFIYLVRDGIAASSSMLEGWKNHLGCLSQDIVRIPENSTISYWCGAIPPHWEKVVNRSLEEICAWVWVEHNRYIIEKIKQSKTFKQKCLCITYENLIQNPLEIINRVENFANLKASAKTFDYLKNKQNSWSTISPPKANKWQEKNPEMAQKIVPQITSMMSELGYAHAIDELI